MAHRANGANLLVDQAPTGGLLVHLSGDYRGQGESPGAGAVRDALDRSPGSKSLSFDSAGLTGWDSRLVLFIRKCSELCQERNLEFRDEGLPEGVRRLLRLAAAVPEQKDARRTLVKVPFLQMTGESVLKGWGDTTGLFTFLGECLVALGKLLRGRASFRWADTFLIMQQCGPQALGIVALINFLVGLILAFVGAIQLSKFGA